MSQSVASETRLPIGLVQGAGSVGKRRLASGGGRTAIRRVGGVLGDAASLLLVVLLVPVVILIVGTPLAFFVRLLLEFANRM